MPQYEYCKDLLREIDTPLERCNIYLKEWVAEKDRLENRIDVAEEKISFWREVIWLKGVKCIHQGYSLTFPEDWCEEKGVHSRDCCIATGTKKNCSRFEPFTPPEEGNQDKKE